MVEIADLQCAMSLSNRLEQFKVKMTNPYKINFRCVVCGDSKKSRTKARGWLIEDHKDKSFRFFCHNCGASMSFHSFLKYVDPMVYNDYITSKYISDAKRTPSTSIDPSQFKTAVNQIASDPLRRLKKISQLPVTHPIRQYIDGRKIPPNQHYRLYYAPKFMAWVNTVLPGKFPNTANDHPRLIMPFIDRTGKCFGVAARGFDPDGLRYMSIMFDDVPKVFGADKVTFDAPYNIVEGALDSLFLSNAIAMAGADGSTDHLPNIQNATFVFDNEPRNKEIHKRIERLIREGRSVCIWPSSIAQKDINEMVLAGVKDIDGIIKQNTFNGLEASLRLSMWRKT